MVQFKYDTHVHTSETSKCGKVCALDVVTTYKEAGYQGIVITDHYYAGFFKRSIFKSWEKKIDSYLSGYRIAAAEGKKQGLDVIQAMELTFMEGPNDYLVYGLDEKFLKENKELYTLGLAKFKELIKDKNVLIIQAHPFRPHLTPADPKLLDGVEVYNGNPRHDSRNDLAHEYAEKHSLKMLSGSDFHQPDDAARGGIIVTERITSSSELIDVINNNKILKLIET